MPPAMAAMMIYMGDTPVCHTIRAARVGMMTVLRVIPADFPIW